MSVHPHGITRLQLDRFSWNFVLEHIFWKSLKNTQVSLKYDKKNACRSQWARYRKCRSAAACLLRLRFRIPPETWMFVCCECRVLSVKTLCDELISHLEDPCRLRSIVVCDIEASRKKRPWRALGRSATGQKKLIMGTSHEGDTRWRSWLRHCATSRKVAGSIPDGVIGIFHWHNPSGRTMTLTSTQPLREYQEYFLVVKAAGA